MLYRSSVAERGLTGIANIFRSRLSGLDDLLQAGAVPLTKFQVETFARLRRRVLDAEYFCRVLYVTPRL